ncbi:tRNA (adenine(22)-N(1))-methyltransferase [Christensenella intestinihominis]|uniref:tRNA (adenine(22)-N(1))-methyltransferase n=2 Tax=Christensenella intestinihominis TaxID=1851429 RepID=UPI00156002AF|nr:class I SAM-dependent methyltransferase [Christensenella intestinihominis]
MTPRMRAIVDFVDGADTAADIGCDHGRISAALIEKKRAKRVFACDISEQSLQKAKNIIAGRNITGITPLISDGLGALEGKTVGCIIITGMGGLLIRDILAAGIGTAKKANQLILGPQGNEYELRTFLYRNGFTIKDESIVKDAGHYYQVIAAAPGEGPPPQEVYLHFGYYPAMRREPLQKEFLQNRLRELESIISRAKQGKDTQEYLAVKRRLRDQVMEVLRCL